MAKGTSDLLILLAIYRLVSASTAGTRNKVIKGLIWD